MKKILLITCSLLLIANCQLSIINCCNAATLSSPNNRLIAEINSDKDIVFSMSVDGETVVSRSHIGMVVDKWKIGKGKFTISNNKDYNQGLLRFGDFDVEFRLYNDGLAYRFSGKKKGEIIVRDEIAEFAMPEDFEAWVPYAPSRTKKEDCTPEEQLWGDHQSQYKKMKISEMQQERLAITPFVISLNNGKKLCIAESDIRDYPGMYLKRSGVRSLPYGGRLEGAFPRVPSLTEVGGHGNIEKLVRQRHDYIAKTDGRRTFPWRCFIVADRDAQLLETDMVYRLATPCQLKDTSWIRPGKTAWDWWNNSALFGVDFEAGFNTETYKYFVDFSAKYGLEYILIDEGWFNTQSTDIFDLSPQLNLEEIIRYADSKGVGVFLWAGYLSLRRDLEKAARH